LSHGDVFCSLDIGYQRMKKILQNPITMFILRKIPLSWRYKLKDMLKNKSSSTSYNPYNQHIYQVVDNTVAQFAKKYKADVVIHGHTHKPNYYQVKLDDNIVITRIEIPDWVNRKPGGYVILEDTTIKIYDSNGIAI
jgi:UDP-2,3-diacylglucosamine hydrolase